MPGRRDAGPIDTALCRRCQQSAPAITVRTEPLCKACVHKYVSTKVVKRMESFRVRHSEPEQERTLLLPLSLGVCSIALLQILSQHLKGQVEKTGRTGFKLHVLHVEDDSSQAESESATYEQVKQRYPEHTYSRSSIPDIFSLEDTLHSIPAMTDNELVSDGAEDTAKFEHFLSSLDSATSRADATEILRRKLIAHFAKSNNCEAVLWGDSTTRLAERTLAETAKGRGFALPWIVTDGESPCGVQSFYPMRDLLSKEIAAYTKLVDPPVDDLALFDEPKAAVSTKNTTIDELMKQYFVSVERDYPSIVANVVKTAGKLQGPALSEIELQCEVCGMPLYGHAPERSRLCYGCIRMLPSSAGRPIG